MDKGFTFEWIFISWVITLVIHHHSIKRSSISENKDKLVELLSSLSDLSWLSSDNDSLYLEERYNTKIERIRWKVMQLNQLAACSILPSSSLDPLYDFDVESYLSVKTHEDVKKKLKFALQDSCDTIIDSVEKTYFEKISTSKIYILWSGRHTWGGILFGLTLVYLLIEIMSFFYK